MKRFSFVMLFAFLAVSAAAQTPDSLKIRYDSLINGKVTRLDSATDRINNKVDSLQMRMNNALNPDISKITSNIKKPKMPTADSLKAVQEFDSLKRGLTHKIDSLKGLKLPTERYTRKLDSLKALGQNKYVKMAMEKSDMKLPSVNTNLNVENPLSKLENPLPNVDNPLAKIDIDNPLKGQTEKLDGLKDKVGVVNEKTDKIQSYSNEVKNISSPNVGDVKQIPDALENKVQSLDEMKELEKQSGELAKAKEMTNIGKDPEALKKMAVDEGMKAAKNHFEGKEEVLQQAMDKLSKLKEKYSEVNSMTDITKRPPNPMKGKPLIERLIPGVTIQTLKWTYFSLDVSPVISYRFSGHINAGVGWNERFTFQKWNMLSAADRIYGPRVFGSYSFKKGFAAKFDIEKMNALIPPGALTADAGSRQWVWSAFVGLKKDYKFAGNVKGNIQTLYNLYDDHDNSPYSDRFVVRMGFEFPMKKHKKPVGK